LHKSNGSSVNYRLCKIHLILNICFWHCIMMASGENNDTYTDAGYYKPNDLYLRIIDAQENYEANMYYTSSLLKTKRSFNRSLNII
jgi:hypothetical protein